MLALILAAALGQVLEPYDPARGPIYSQPASMGGLAFFEAFRGSEAACTCAAVTGAKGEALTFSRASTATCTKTVGTAPQQIANGDLVTCASGQPVVMPGEDGTAVSGLQVEAAGANAALRSEELDVAPWSGAGSGGAAAPTVAANYLSRSPFTTPVYGYAERLQVPAVSVGQTSLWSQTNLCTAGQNCTPSVYAMATSSACTTDICSYTGGANSQCAQFTLQPGYWTRIYKGATAAGGTGGISIGNCAAATCSGGGSTNACDMLLVGAQAESGVLVPSSYIPTAGAAATRAAVTATFPTGTATAGGTFSMAASIASNVVSSSLPFAQRGVMALLSGGTASWRGLVSSGNVQMTRSFVGSFNGATGATGGINRFAWLHDTGTSVGTCLNGACVTGTLSGSVDASGYSLEVGYSSSESQPYTYGVVKRVCLDPNPARCR